MSLLIKALLAGFGLAGFVAVLWIFTAFANQQPIKEMLTANSYGAVWGIAIFFCAGFFGVLVGMSQAGQRIFNRLL